VGPAGRKWDDREKEPKKLVEQYPIRIENFFLKFRQIKR